MVKALTRVIAVGSVAATSGCYTVTIDEAFWLTPRPSTVWSQDSMATAVPGGAQLSAASVTMPDGGSVPLLIASPPAAHATVIFFGGDDFVIARRGPETFNRLLGAAPVSVVLPEYPAHGTRDGPQSMQRLKDEAIAVYDHVIAHQAVGQRCVIVHGHSLGSFLAAHVAANRPVCGLVLQSSAPNPQEWMASFMRPARFKWWARIAYPFLRFKIADDLLEEDNETRVRRSTAPLLVIVGADDDITPPRLSQMLFHASGRATGSKWLAVFPGRGHSDVLMSDLLPYVYTTFVNAAVQHNRR